MKMIKHLILIFLFFITEFSVNAQCELVTCVKKNVNCGDSVQLDAEPILDGVWDSVHTGLSDNFNAIYFRDSNTGFAATTTGGIYKTTDGGTNWISKSSGTISSLIAIRFLDKNTGYAVGSNSTIIKTTDGGESWVPVNTGTTAKIFRSLYIQNENNIFVIGNTSVLKTIDGGQTWTESQLSSTLFDITFTSVINGYICGSSGTIYQTKDGGNTWIKQITPLNKTFYSLSFVSDSIGYSGGGNSLLKFSSGMSNAENILLPMLLPSSLIRSIYFFNADCGYLTGYDGILNTAFVYKTTDGGQNWVQVANFISKKSMCGSFIGLNTGYICGPGGFFAKLKVVFPTVENYSWTPITGLNNPKIKNPKASPSELTRYEVSRYANGCNATAFVYVNNAPLDVNAGSTKYIGCEGSTQLGTVVTSYRGTAKLRYKWTPSIGLDNDTIANPLASVSETTTYTVQVTTPAGCIGSANKTVAIVPLKINAGADQTISCGGTAQLTASSNYSGTNKLSYKWKPSTELSNDTIANPVCSPKVTTTYVVAVNSQSGCLSRDTVIITVNPLTINAGIDQTISCGANVQLLTTSNYTGTGNLKYKWTPSTGLSNDTIASPVASPASKTTYTVSLTAPSGCKATDNVLVTVNPLVVNVGADISATCGSSVQLGIFNSTGAIKYKWSPSIGLNNDSIANPVAIASNITYNLTATTPQGCTATDNVVINIVPMSAPVINFVGINEKNRNIIYWTKLSNVKIDTYNLYKETNVTNSYTKVGTIPFDSAAVFEDTNSNPDVQSNKYKLSVTDACGNETTLSTYHKTMHLSINKGINNVWNLIWEAYEGYAVSTYNIYRGTKSDNIQIIGSLSGSNTQFSDYTAPGGAVFYQVEAVSTTLAGVKQQNKSSVKSENQSIYSSRSNIATNGISGLFELSDLTNQFTITPNPASDRIQLSVNSINFESLKVSIYNILGSVVMSETVTQKISDIAINKLKSGVYMIEVKTNKSSGIKRLIIKK
jgi:photosystem II stability/assembly factor-like uncharacterized protein